MNIQDIFNTFYLTWNGKPCEVNDPSNYAQCMDLAYAWCDALGVTRDTIRSFYAFQVYTQPKDVTVKYFELIPNTPTGLPKVGDLVIFSNKVGVAGHISISTGKGDTNSFETFDQNWGTPKTPRLVNHNYDAVLGWLRFRVLPEPVITDQTKIPQIENKEVQQIVSDLKAKDSRIFELETQVNDQIKTINDIKNAMVACQNEFNVLKVNYDLLLKEKYIPISKVSKILYAWAKTADGVKS